MAIRHHATILCDYLIKGDDGKFSYIATFRNIATGSLPAIKNPMGVAVEFEGVVGDPYRIALRDPQGGEIVLDEGTVKGYTEKLHKYQQGLIRAAGILEPAVFNMVGKYAIILSSGGRTVHRYNFGVFLRKPAKEDPK